jgi:p-aminobenzoyl-glutamate transporter AbgT
MNKMRCCLLTFATCVFLQVLVSLFQIEKRVGDRLQKWQEDVDKELEQQREAAKFHARPATILVSIKL